MYEQQQEKQQELDRVLQEGNTNYYERPPRIPVAYRTHERTRALDSRQPVTKELIIKGDEWDDTAVIKKLKSGTIEYLRLDKSPKVTLNSLKDIEQYGSNIKILEVHEDSKLITSEGELIALMTKLPKLEALSIESLGFISDTFFVLVQLLGKAYCDQINRLQLESCTSEDLDHTKLLDNCATCFPRLQQLYLTDFYGITRDDVDRVIKDTTLLPELRLLSLSGADMTEYDDEYISELKKLRGGKLDFMY